MKALVIWLNVPHWRAHCMSLVFAQLAYNPHWLNSFFSMNQTHWRKQLAHPEIPANCGCPATLIWIDVFFVVPIEEKHGSSIVKTSNSLSMDNLFLKIVLYHLSLILREVDQVETYPCNTNKYHESAYNLNSQSILWGHKKHQHLTLDGRPRSVLTWMGRRACIKCMWVIIFIEPWVKPVAVRSYDFSTIYAPLSCAKLLCNPHGNSLQWPQTEQIPTVFGVLFIGFANNPLAPFLSPFLGSTQLKVGNPFELYL